ncbi:guanylin-like [Mobula hypostoma]|uniref:guanylin-like n=1 Tax=Mobula hypostoma TaxID=723540 RepID=UPI002FC30911
MKTTSALVLALSCLTSILANVMVQEGKYMFPLEDVKKLWTLMSTQNKSNLDTSGSVSTKLCPCSTLPKVFQSVCSLEDADKVFLRLELLAKSADMCEICAYAACTGCNSVNITKVL